MRNLRVRHYISFAKTHNLKLSPNTQTKFCPMLKYNKNMKIQKAKHGMSA
jgi:hypothetical protein